MITAVAGAGALLRGEMVARRSRRGDKIYPPIRRPGALTAHGSFVIAERGTRAWRAVLWVDARAVFRWMRRMLDDCRVA